MTAPLTDTILFALAQMVDDAQVQPPREPSHSDLDFLVKSAGLTEADPKTTGQLVGKAKRVRAVLSWALENNVAAGRKLTGALVRPFFERTAGFALTHRTLSGLPRFVRWPMRFRRRAFFSHRKVNSRLRSSIPWLAWN
ncbi:MAG TPA: hypothetical protein VHE61_03015 [Opitutaceae bacterium]|nr:hypothetical protein [Opitutaceae bacterium]